MPNVNAHVSIYLPIMSNPAGDLDILHCKPDLMKLKKGLGQYLFLKTCAPYLSKSTNFSIDQSYLWYTMKTGGLMTMTTLTMVVLLADRSTVPTYRNMKCVQQRLFWDDKMHGYDWSIDVARPLP